MGAWFFPCALLCGFGLDLLIGDPERLPHPVRLIGAFAAWLERKLRGERGMGKGKGPDSEVGDGAGDCGAGMAAGQGESPGAGSAKREGARGLVLVVAAVGATLAVSAAVLWACFLAHPALAFAVASVMCWQCLSVKDLAKEAGNVAGHLMRDDLPGARSAVSRIVGRDVDRLDGEGVAKAAMESVAESAADGVVAPLLYLAIGGPCLGMAYKAINTLDSMIGYKNEAYLDFGRAAARLDDFAGYVPARLAALCMIASAWVLGQDGWGALRIWRRDRRKHASPNSAQCESALAGALGVALAGDACYFGETVRKPIIGDACRPPAPSDIRTAVRLMYGTSCIFLPAAFFISAGVSALVYG